MIGKTVVKGIYNRKKNNQCLGVVELTVEQSSKQSITTLDAPEIVERRLKFISAECSYALKTYFWPLARSQFSEEAYTHVVNPASSEVEKESR
jgi:hypothetical protein